MAFVSVIQEHFWAFLEAVGVTLRLTAVSLILAVVIGIRRLLMKISGSSNEGRSNVRVVRSGQR